jgi:hypothetical protein
MAQPLTKLDRSGQRYRRPDAIERAIDDSVGLPLDAVRARAGLSAARAERLSLALLQENFPCEAGHASRGA